MPTWRTYCCQEHYHNARRGLPRPERRRGQVLYCSSGGCKNEVGYLRPSRVKRAARHFCPEHLEDWRRENPPRPRVSVYGKCGHPVSKPGYLLCHRCFHRGNDIRVRPAYGLLLENIPALEGHTGEDREHRLLELRRSTDVVKEALMHLRKRIPDGEIAVAAGITARTIKNTVRWLQREGKGISSDLRCRFLRQGSAAGFRAHKLRGETPCLSCRLANRDYRRELYRRRKAGTLERKPIPHGTYNGYSAHLRRGEAACDPCKRASATYARDRRRKTRERGSSDGSAR